MINILIHVMNDDPILGEVESLPGLTDQLIKVSHPRKKDGKDLPYLQANVTEVIWPITRITFIEVMPSEDEDEIFGFVRE
jgi:hypothetical protein